MLCAIRSPDTAAYAFLLSPNYSNTRPASIMVPFWGNGKLFFVLSKEAVISIYVLESDFWITDLELSRS